MANDTGFKGSGTASISIKRADGSYGGWNKVGNVTMYDITPESDTKTRESCQEDTFGQALDTDITAKPTKIKFEFDTLTGQNIALALSSELVPNNNKTGGTVTAESVQVFLGKSIRLANEFVTQLTLGTLAAGTDYTQDPLNSHFVFINDNAAIADGAIVSAAYHYAGLSQDTLLGGLTSFEAKVEVDGMNRANNKKFIHHAGKVTFTSNGGFDFLSKDFVKAQLDGIANIDDDPLSISYGFPYITRVNIVKV